MAKLIYTAITTLDAVSTPRTRLEREFDPEAVRRMKEARRSRLRGERSAHQVHSWLTASLRPTGGA